MPLFDFFKAKPAIADNKIEVESLPNYKAYNGQVTSSPWGNSIFDGSKFAGGFGETQLQTLDYWTLRARSEQLFNENIYARGLIRRLITNEINTGLTPEAIPDSSILDLSDDYINDWAETVESRFHVWSKSPKVCDWRKAKTFGAIQREARREALISGDVLVVLRQSFDTSLPMIQLVSGSRIKTPWNTDELPKENEIRHGVELSKNGRVVAYWIEQDDGTFNRLVANSKKSGRRIAWLVYGCDKRMDSVRGQPLLSLVLQSLKEIDRYRDAAQRKAVINSMLAMFIKKDVDKIGSLPIQGAAVKNASVPVHDTDGRERDFKISKLLPGTVLDELQQGETPIGFNSNGTDIDFPAFESAVIEAVAWSNEVPGEILKLAFSNNYSASQAAINEFKIYLNKIWGSFGEDFCQPIYNDWLISEVLLGNITAIGLLDAFRDPKLFDELGAWQCCQWFGSIKPSTDQLKQAKGSKMLVDEGWSTNAREARINTGTKFIRNIKKLKYENELKAEAMKPLLDLEQSLKLEEPKQFEAERDIAEEDQVNEQN